MWEDANNLGRNTIWLTRPVAANNTDVMSSNSNQYSVVRAVTRKSRRDNLKASIDNTAYTPDKYGAHSVASSPTTTCVI